MINGHMVWTYTASHLGYWIAAPLPTGMHRRLKCKLNDHSKMAPDRSSLPLLRLDDQITTNIQSVNPLSLSEQCSTSWFLVWCFELLGRLQPLINLTCTIPFSSRLHGIHTVYGLSIRTQLPAGGTLRGNTRGCDRLPCGAGLSLQVRNYQQVYCLDKSNKNSTEKILCHGER